MTATRELRLTASAAWAAYESGKAGPTLTNSEIKRLRDTASKAHDAWLTATTDLLCGGAYAAVN